MYKFIAVKQFNLCGSELNDVKSNENDNSYDLNSRNVYKLLLFVLIYSSKIIQFMCNGK